MNKAISSSKAPAALGAYSQAVSAYNDTVYVSGCFGFDPKTGEPAAPDVANQARQALQNLGAILREAGLGFHNVVKCTVFLTDLADYAAVNEVCAEFFPEPYPACSILGVAALPKGGKVEIDAIAVI